MAYLYQRVTCLVRPSVCSFSSSGNHAMVCTPSEHRLITQSLPGENECAASADPGQELATRGMTGTGTEGVLPYRLLKPGAQVQCSSCICDDDSGVQEEVQSAGESRRGAAAEPLWSLSAGDPREMASLIAGWGDLEKSPALAPGHPGWRNGVLKVCFCMHALPANWRSKQFVDRSLKFCIFGG